MLSGRLLRLVPSIFGLCLGGDMVKKKAQPVAPHEYRRVVGHVCAWCGREFEGMVHARYCCQACTQAAYRERKRGAGEAKS